MGLGIYRELLCEGLAKAGRNFLAAGEPVLEVVVVVTGLEPVPVFELIITLVEGTETVEGFKEVARVKGEPNTAVCCCCC